MLASDNEMVHFKCSDPNLHTHLNTFYNVRHFVVVYELKCLVFVFKKYLDNRWYFHFIIEQLPNPTLYVPLESNTDTQTQHSFVIHLIPFVSFFISRAFTKTACHRNDVCWCTSFSSFFVRFVLLDVFVVQRFTFFSVFFVVAVVVVVPSRAGY